MSIDTRSDPSLAYTYRGFTGPQAPAPPAPEISPWRRPKVVAIVGSACAVGLALGLWAKPQFGPDNRAREPMRPVSAVPMDGGVQIVVDPGKAPPVVETPGRLEVLPPDMAAAAGAARTAVLQGAPPPTRISIPEREAPLVAPPALPEVAEVRASMGRARPSFDCRAARSRAEEMVCQDPALAAADRRMAQAFRRATQSGVPYDELRGEQDDWLSIREAAARRSPEAVASIYDQRTQELEAMSEEEWE